jgi:hypothetical protein
MVKKRVRDQEVLPDAPVKDVKGNGDGDSDEVCVGVRCCTHEAHGV